MNEIPNVRDIMTSKVLTLHQGMGLDEAIRKLLENGFSGAPVVNADGELVGILSQKDCLRMFFGGLYGRLPVGTVSEYMCMNVTTCRPNDSLLAVAQVFFRQGFHRLPVVDENGQLLGLVSRSDVLDGSREIWGRGRSERLDLETGFVDVHVESELAHPRETGSESQRFWM